MTFTIENFIKVEKRRLEEYQNSQRNIGAFNDSKMHSQIEADLRECIANIQLHSRAMPNDFNSLTAELVGWQIQHEKELNVIKQTFRDGMDSVVATALGDEPISKDSQVDISEMLDLYMQRYIVFKFLTEKLVSQFTANAAQTMTIFLGQLKAADEIQKLNNEA